MIQISHQRPPMAYLVYVKGLRGPAPEKWPELLRDMSGQPRPYLVKHLLREDEAQLSLDSLARKYPPPVLEAA